MAVTPEQARALALAAARKRQQEAQAAQPQKRGFGQELLRGVKMGAADLYRGATSVANMPLDLLSSAHNFATSNLYPEGYDVTINGKKEHRSGLVPTATERQNEALLNIGTPQPENRFEEVMGAVNRGVGGAAAGVGLGGALAQSASPVVSGVGTSMASAPGSQLAAGAGAGAASEGTRQAGGGPVLQTAAGLVGGVGAGRLTAGRSTTPEPPTTDQLRVLANDAYKRAETAGVALSPNSFGQRVEKITQEAQAAGLNPVLHPKATEALKQLQNSSGPTFLSFQNLETLRKIVKAAASSVDADERRVAQIMRDEIDDYITNLGPGDISAGDAQGASQAIREARSLWSRMSKGEEVEELVDRARIRAAGQFTGSGFENALRTEFRQLVLNPKRLRLFTQEEQQALRRVAEGGPIENTLRMIGKAAPTGIVSSALGSGGGYAAFGPVGAAAVPIAGFAAREGATMLTARNARLASELMRRGGKPPPGSGVLKPEVYAAALLGTNAARGQ